jgi:3-keto-disaccharide hydrolase
MQKTIGSILILTGIAVFLNSCSSTPQSLINSDLSNFTYKPGAWTVEDGVLARQGGGDIWTKEQYGNFILDLEFKVDKGTNSGIFIRTGNPKDCVQTGLEIQVYDSYGRDKPGKHDCGAVYDCLAPSKNPIKEAGQWNHMTITANGPIITIVMNGEPIINMNVDLWTEPHKNPQDDSKNKFNNAIKDFPRVGYIGFQDHGKPVWYRNVTIMPLEG